MFHLYATFQVWEIVYSKDGSVKEVLKVMQLKGHKVVFANAISCVDDTFI